jgi:hypothetical protein
MRRVNREPLSQTFSRCRGTRTQLFDRGPRRFGIDVIWRHGRDPAPVIDPRRDQVPDQSGAEIRRRLDVHGRPEHDPCHRHGPKHVVVVRLRRICHAGVVLGPEVLDDDFLDVAVAAMQHVDRQERLDALGAGFADADQDAGGERHVHLARRLDGGEPRRRHLVGRAVMRAAALAQPRRNILQHDALRHRHTPERGDVGFGHHAGIDVRQEPGFAQHQRAHRSEVIDRGPVAEPVERAPRRLVFELRLVTQREQRLMAAGLHARARDREHLAGR